LSLACPQLKLRPHQLLAGKNMVSAPHTKKGLEFFRRIVVVSKLEKPNWKCYDNFFNNNGCGKFKLLPQPFKINITP
jgi:hypothetical protein